MQVILRDDVQHLGRRGDVVKVAVGYARNYLVPKGLAYFVTPGIKRQVDSELRARAARDVREANAAHDLAQRLAALTVVRLFRRAGDSGTLFGSVTSADIAAALAKQSVVVDKRQVRLADPIKRVGTHRVNVHVHKEVQVEIIVEVEPGDSE